MSDSDAANWAVVNEGAVRTRDEPKGGIAIPDHELVRRIGRGSYGEVWLARNTMGTYRAVKVLRRQSFSDLRPFQRELSGIRSFEPVSRSHEGFVDILQVGINDEAGYFYYVMELGDDQESPQQVNPERYKPKTLARELFRRGRMPFQECLQLGLRLSDALADLHRRGLVHRDVKPSNIIFVGGEPKLADIGLVAAVDEARSYVGTEGFIPPEGPGTPQADIYSLGKLLYEASTGKDRQEFPDLPTRFDEIENREFLELNEVIVHACHYDLRKRYSSADSMHADLQMLATGRSVRRLRLLERRFSALKRTAVLVAAAALLAALLLYPVYHEWRDVTQTRQRQVGASVAYGTRAVESGDLAGALPYFAEALRLDRGDPGLEAQHRLRVGSTLAQCPTLLQMWFATQQVDEAEFSRDGTKVLIVESFGRAQLYDVASGRAVSPPFEQKTFFWRGALSPEADRVVLGGEDQIARIWSVTSGTVLLQLEHPDKVLSARFSPDGKRIITGCRDMLGRVWDSGTGRLEFTLPGHQDALLFAAFSPDGRRIVTCSKDSSVRLWDASDGHSLGPPLQHSSWVYFAAFGPEDELVTASFDHHARIWDLRTGQEIFPALPHEDGVKSAEYSPDGRFILTACLDGTARIWSRRTHLPWKKVPLLHHSSRVTQARFSPDDHRVVTCCVDGTVRVWDLASTELNQPLFRATLSSDGSRYVVREPQGFRIRDTLSHHSVSPLVMAETGSSEALLDPGGSCLLISSAVETNASRNRVTLWECESGKALGPPVLLTKPATRFVVAPGWSALLVASGKTVSAWDVGRGTLLWTKDFKAPVENGLILNPAGTVAAGWAENECRIWELPGGRELFLPIKHQFPVRDLAFSPDGKRFVTASGDDGFTRCYAQVWDTQSRRAIGVPLRHADGLVRASFSPDGTMVVTASEDFTARIWDAATGKPLGPSMRHQGQVVAAAFSPDSEWLLTAGVDRTARIWSSRTGDPLTPPFPHQRPLAYARFLDRGQAIITLDSEDNARVLNLTIDRRPSNDILRFARLLSGEMVIPLGSTSIAKEPLPQLWERLRAAYPTHFVVSTEQAAAWHVSQADECEQEQNWAAAIFHIHQLGNLTPGDPLLQRRLAILEQRLRREWPF
jgi:WD40 repeat protein